jgi:lysophospholipase L1-like esterase
LINSELKTSVRLVGPCEKVDREGENKKAYFSHCYKKKEFRYIFHTFSYWGSHQSFMSIETVKIPLFVSLEPYIFARKPTMKKLFARFRTPAPYDFRQNLQYQIQTEFHAIYKKTAAVVMFGDSLMAAVLWNEILNRCDLANRGIGQDTTAGMVARLPGIVALRPKVCFILGGSNDVEKLVARELTVGNLQAICRLLIKENIDPILHTVPYVTASYPNPSLNAVLADLNLMIQQMAASERVHVIDLNRKLAPNAFLEDKYALFDGVHLNAQAYLVWKGLIEAVL